MKKTTKISSVLLAFLMLFSSVGFSINVHFCKGEIENISIMGSNSTCNMENNFHKKCSKENISKEKCCVNKSFILSKINNASSEKSYSSNAWQSLLFIASQKTYLGLNASTHKAYSSPYFYLKKNFTVLFQVFRI